MQMVGWVGIVLTFLEIMCLLVFLSFKVRQKGIHVFSSKDQFAEELITTQHYMKGLLMILASLCSLHCPDCTDVRGLRTDHEFFSSRGGGHHTFWNCITYFVTYITYWFILRLLSWQNKYLKGTVYRVLFLLSVFPQNPLVTRSKGFKTFIQIWKYKVLPSLSRVHRRSRIEDGQRVVFEGKTSQHADTELI